MYSLPEWAQAGARGARRPERAVVGPDDVLTFTDETWAALWPEENELL